MIYLSLSFKLSALSFTVTRYELYTLCLATYSLRLNNNAMFTCRRLSYSVGRRYLSSVAGYCEGWMPYALGPMLLRLGQLFMDDPIIKEFINLWTSLNSLTVFSNLLISLSSIQCSFQNDNFIFQN